MNISIVLKMSDISNHNTGLKPESNSNDILSDHSTFGSKQGK